MNTYEDQDLEVLQRVRRIETRIHVMCTQLGVSGNYAEINRCEVGREPDGAVSVTMESVDVALSSIKRAIVQAGVDPTTCGEIILWHKDQHFASIFFDQANDYSDEIKGEDHVEKN